MEITSNKFIKRPISRQLSNRTLSEAGGYTFRISDLGSQV